MTTEVIVVNRMGVALATDSAVTLGGAKTFNTANKLFELDCKCPIGIMINGNMNFLGVPWEIMIKEYREERENAAAAPPDAEPVNAVQAALDNFLAWVGDTFVNEKAIKIYVAERAADELNQLFEATFEKLRAGGEGELNAILLKEAKARLSRLKKMRHFRDIQPEAILAAYRKDIDPVIGKEIKNSFQDTAPAPLRTVLRNVVVAALLSSERSPNLETGLVVAGFARSGEPYFPSVRIVDIDGAIPGALRRFPDGRNHSYDVDQYDNKGTVISVAQTDVADRLLGGPPEVFAEKTTSFVRDAMDQAHRELVDHFTKAGLNRASTAKKLAKVSDDIVARYVKWAGDTRRDANRDLSNIVAAMPKADIAELAEALVAITVVERKASSDPGTVGGPIDVAMITKHEGFVWIKRKFFFEGKLNPRYYARKFRMTPERGDSNDESETRTEA